ncbi:MAG: HlyD family efflux transporter periplasmic adaptor subunit [Phycisphaerales bacterium]|nr:HlyD family efflux transporter periplasmic adaptor subunit [Planctomycetota bacterium]MBL6997873.1 HlyD family efflux transporter periplasmic adaptor subunit [Phycisphaerales bacterium]
MPTSRTISFLTRAIVSVICVVIGYAILSMLISSKPKLEIVSGNRSFPAVIVMEAKQIPIARRTVGYGTADALQHADVPTQVSSIVTLLPPTTRVGYVVQKGDLLVELDDVDYKQQVVRAELSLATSKSEMALIAVESCAADERAELARRDQELSEAELQRITDAFKRGAAKQREIDIAKQKTIAATAASVNATESANRFPIKEERATSTIATKQAELALAQENLKRCKVLSPIDGVIQEIDVRVGEHVSNGKRIVRVVNSGNLEIPLRLPSYARSYVNVLDPVNLRSAGFGKRHWGAHISRIAPEDDQQTRTMVAFVDVEQNPNNNFRIPPGIFLRGEVVNTTTATPRWVVPRRALRDDRLMIVRDSVLRSIPVAIDYSIKANFDQFGLPDYDWAVLQTPLAEGDLVVVDPGGNLRDGMSVRSILATEVAAE